MRTVFLAALAAMLLVMPTTARAQDATDYLSFGIGQWDILDSDEATDFRVEYRPGTSLLGPIRPFVGAEFTSDASFWVGGGLLADFMVTDQFYLTPSVGVGLYADGGSDKDLGYPIEFRSQIEAGYQFQNQHRIGVAFGHISNAGLSDDNPGTEILNIYYHLPFNGF